MFSKRSSSSISLETVTPSLVTVGTAEGLVEDHVAAGGAQGDGHHFGQFLDAAKNATPGLVRIEQLFRHDGCFLF